LSTKVVLWVTLFEDCKTRLVMIDMIDH